MPWPVGAANQTWCADCKGWFRTAGGTPFASRAPGGLSRVSMEWVKLGIVPERSPPASPQDNGRPSTLKQTTLAPPDAAARIATRQRENEWRAHVQLGHARARARNIMMRSKG
jgi:hypothetical protein